MSNAYRFVINRKDTILRYAVAMPLLIPAAWLLTIDILVFIGWIALGVLGADQGWEPPISGDILLYSLVLFSWATLLYWAAATDSIKRTIARTCWAFSTGSFLFPVVAVMSLSFLPPDPSDQIIPHWLFVFIFTVVGLVLGFTMRGAAMLMSPGSPEASGGIWYVFKAHRRGLLRSSDRATAHRSDGAAPSGIQGAVELNEGPGENAQEGVARKCWSTKY